MVPRPGPAVIELCSGYGGWSLALQLLGIGAKTVGHVERDSHAAATLVARMEDSSLDPAPVWSDLATFDGRPWRGRVDWITAGLPCQPFSAAGQKRGLDDDRHLWPMACRIIADVRPTVVLLENVPDVIRKQWLPHVLADLADLGFDAEWGLLSAADLGAPHLRERFWCVAYSDLDGLAALWAERLARRDADGPGCPDVGDAGRLRRPEITISTPGDESPDGWRPQRADVVDGPVEDVGIAEIERLERVDGARLAPLAGPAGASREDVPDADGDRRVRRSGTSRGADRTGEGLALAETEGLCGGPDMADAARLDEREPDEAALADSRRVAWQDAGRRSWPPLPDDREAWERWISDGGPEPQIRRSVDGPTGRLVKPRGLPDQLHLLGNGLVPQVAAAAVALLIERALQR